MRKRDWVEPVDYLPAHLSLQFRYGADCILVSERLPPGVWDEASLLRVPPHVVPVASRVHPLGLLQAAASFRRGCNLLGSLQQLLQETIQEQRPEWRVDLC